MGLPQKIFHIDNQHIFEPIAYGPFRVHQMCDLACCSGYEVGLHDHIGHEITYIVSGEGVFARNGVSYDVSKGMLFLISRNDNHYIRSSEDDPLRIMNLCVSFNTADPLYERFRKIDEFMDEFTDPTAIDRYGIQDAFAGALKEMAQDDLMSEEMMISWISQILALTYRNFRSKPHITHFPGSRTDMNRQITYEVIRYIDTNLLRITNLADISKELCYSYAYMSSVFSNVYNETIQDYYIRRKFEKAALYLDEGMSIIELSEIMGYRSVHSFSRAFTRFHGIPPGAYKNREMSAGMYRIQRQADL